MRTSGGTKRLARIAGAVGLTWLSGCGAAYYGAAAAIFVSQKGTKQIDESFPDAVPTDDAVEAGFATLRLGAAQVTVDRTDASGATVALTGFEVLGVDFPPGYGESQSNRDAEETLFAGDRLVVRVDGDVSRELIFDATDVASVGSLVAARIAARVRALSPIDPAVSPAAYAQFSGSYDQTTGAYTFRSGAPGERSAVLFEPQPRPEVAADETPDDLSTTTARRLGLGAEHGGIEVAGADSIAITVLNRGTDSVTEATSIDLYLSHDKTLDPRVDILFDRISTDQSIAVGEAIRFYRRNGEAPPSTLVDADFTPGPYYVLFDVESAGEAEASRTNNLVASRRTIDVYAPIDDPATSTVETANTLDFAIDRTSSPISVVTGRTLNSVVTITNLGQAVDAAGVDIDLDVVLSSDEELDAFAAIRDPAGAVAGLRVNPTDPDRPVDIKINNAGTGPMQASVAALASGNVITLTYDGTGGAGVATVQSLVDALNGSLGTLVDAFSDGAGDPATDTANALLAAASFTAASQVTAKDIHITTSRVRFQPIATDYLDLNANGVRDTATEPLSAPMLTRRSFLIGAVVRQTVLQTFLMPRKLFPIYRIRPVISGGGQNAKNDVRVASNYCRVYDAARATFDTTTGALLPTVSSEDFADLEAVTLRPVNTGSIRQGQQRVFAFEMPSTGLTIDEAQLLVVLHASGFDAHLDLLNSQGEFLAGSDDSPIGTDPLIYVAAQANAQSKVFYLVIAPARSDESDLAGGGETLELTISVNSRQPADLALVNAVNADGVVSPTKQRYEPDETRTENDVLVPFSLSGGSAEVLFVLPQRARVNLRARPVFQVGVDSIITAFVEGQVPAPVDHQKELAENLDVIVFKPQGGTILSSHVLERGVYTLAIDSLSNLPDTQKLRLEIDTEFIPDDFLPAAE